jgi:hypothetical protein
VAHFSSQSHAEVWFMTGNALSMAGSFSFILLSIWMAMKLGSGSFSFFFLLFSNHLMESSHNRSFGIPENENRCASDLERIFAKHDLVVAPLAAHFHAAIPTLRHAAVSAQAFETRLLTQMVRLPIPSWQAGR